MLTKKQRDMLAKALRMLRTGVEETERCVEKGSAQEVLTHIQTMHELTSRLKLGLEGHLGAAPLLLHVAEKRPKVAAKIGRPKLRLVK